MIWLGHFGQDVRYGWRTLVRNPAFATTTILTLAVGLALTTGVFTVFNAYLLRSYAVHDPGSLHQIVWHARDAANRGLRWQDFEALAARRDLFASALAQTTRYVSYEGRVLAAELVSDSYFEMLEPVVAPGRGLHRGDEGAAAVVISHQAWASLFARDPAVIGTSIELSGHRFTVVGVLGERFAGLHAMPRDVWILFRDYAALAAPGLLDTEARALDVTVRLLPGVTRERAQAAITPLLVDARERERQSWTEVRRQDKPAPLSLRLLALLSPVFVAFALVLLAGCANVSSVMLARAVVRQREIAVRLSLGASRGRIIRQLLTEALLISGLAAVTGLALSAAGLRIGTAVFFSTLPASLAAILRTAPLTLDYRVFLFALLAGGVSTLAFALVPALQASRPTNLGSLGAHAAGGRRGARLRGALVVAQIAISLLLVVPALSLARNGLRVRAADVGFDITDVISFNVRQGETTARVRQLADVLEPEPRVERFAVASGNPFFGPAPRVVLESHGQRLPTPITYVSPDYFATLRIPITRGRQFRRDEAQSEGRVAIVSEATARAMFPGRDAIGQVVRIANEPAVILVGICADVVSGIVIDGPEPGHIYLPTAAGAPHGVAILARARTAGGLAPAPLQQILNRAAAEPQVFEAIPLEEVRSIQIYPFLASSSIGSLLGAIALILSISGLFGALMYALTQRSKEIGIRVALGATAATIVGMIMRQTAWLAGLGSIIGLAGAFVLLRLLAASVRAGGLSLTDGLPFAAGFALVLVAAGVAAWHPAQRAARIDPAVTLRAE